MSGDAKVLTVRIAMLSDWHIGTGGGRYGVLDSRIVRDGDDLPFIPASTLKGMMRDAVETAASALDNGAEDGAWSTFATALFGSQPVVDGSSGKVDFEAPTNGLLAFDNARLPQNIRVRIKQKTPGHARLRRALAFVKPGVAMERESGAAKEDMLRFDEVGRRGIQFVGSVSIALPAEALQDAIALLQAGCFVLEGLGGKRRRGLGEVAVSLFDGDNPLSNELCQRLEYTPQILTGHLNTRAGVKFAEGADGGFDTVSLTYQLAAPVLAASLIENNIVTGEKFLPGSMLLPAIKRLLSGAGFEGVDDAIFASDIRILPAYPVVGDAVSMPMPACFEKYKKASEKTVLNALHSTGDGSLQRKSMGRDFAAINGKIIATVSTRMRLTTHNVIDDKIQRPTSEMGGVFAYEALEADQIFAGEVRVRKSVADTWSGWKDKLQGAISIGRTRNSGYGEVRLGKSAAKMVSSNADSSDTVILYFYSDAILRNTAQQTECSLASVIKAVSATCGVLPTDIDVDTDQAFLTSKTISGWSVSAGLPRSSLLAVAAGSVVRLKLKCQHEQGIWQKLSDEGLGERRAEGFGVVIVNPPFLSTDAALELEKNRYCNVELATNAAHTRPLTTDEERLARLIEENAWRAYLLDAIEALIADDALFKETFDFECGSSTAPENAQLGRIRSAIMSKPESERAAALKAYLQRQKRQKWDACLENGVEPSDDICARLKGQTAERLWKLVDEEQSSYFFALMKKALDAEPALLLCAHAADDVKKTLFSWASTALILAAIQMHVRRASSTSEGGEADGAAYS